MDELQRTFTFRMPALVMGLGGRRQLGAVAQPLGRRVTVITDPAMTGQPGFADCLAQLRNSGLLTRVFDGVVPDPPMACVTDAVAAARAHDTDLVVGIGGGSSLDVAKCTAVLLCHDTDLATLLEPDGVPGRGRPTVLVPTTAGSGSEVTPIAILSDPAQHRKRGIVSDHLIADVALVDPELCATLPPVPTAYTGVDALTHAIEAFTNRHAVPFIDRFALEAVRLTAANLRGCVADGGNLAARYGMSLASLYGGLCLKAVNTAAVHALAYPLGCRFKVPHGVANALLLPHVMRFNAASCTARYAQLAEALHDPDAVAAVECLTRELGTNRKLREFGVTAADLPVMAASAMAVQRLLRNNPRQVTEADALALYEAAW